MDQQPAWYHWMLAVACAAALVALGASMVLNGSEPSSRFYVIDDLIVRVSGGVLVATAAALPFRWRWGYSASAAVLALLVIESFVTYNPSSSIASPDVFVVGVVITLVAPLLLVTWLKKHMTATRSLHR
jgi:peptidoglycan/LPS O-acetylase OafA/YrhL